MPHACGLHLDLYVNLLVFQTLAKKVLCKNIQRVYVYEGLGSSQQANDWDCLASASQRWPV